MNMTIYLSSIKVNGEKIDEVQLKEGDRIQFDKIKFIVSEPS